MFDILKKYEKIMIQSLMVMMAIVLGLATIDLGWLIIKDITKPPYLLLSVEQLLETIMKTYITQDMPHYEVVLSVAIIAIARKVIILDVKELDAMTLIGIAAIAAALTFGYFLMKRSQSFGRNSNAPDNKDTDLSLRSSHEKE